MGYVHYFELKADLTDKVLDDVMKTINHYEEIVAYKSNETDRKASINKKEIRFNGREGYGSETLLIEKGKSNFCKTAGRAYDLPVCEVLAVLKYHYGDDFELFSDGFCEKEEGYNESWALAYENVIKRFKYEDFKLLDE